MKKVVIIQGSPRKKGNSSLLAAALKESICSTFSDAAQIDVYSLATHVFAPCIGCEKCTVSGECIRNDDMNALVDALDAANVLIWISPLYFGTVSAQLKAIIDRFQLMWSRTVLAGEEKGIPSNRSRPAFAVYVSAKDDPFATPVKKAAALLPLRYASNTAGFTLGDDATYALIGAHKPGDIESVELEDSVSEIIASLTGRIRAL